jgi:glycosyltransferase involved in cell wall biosynthesis
VVTLTHEDKFLLRNYAPRIEVIPNMLTITPKSVTNYHAKRVIAAGRYVRQKGYDMLLEAWYLTCKDIKGWELYIFGNEDRSPYQELVDKYNLNESVHLLPATQNIVEEFSKSSIYVMSSRFEGFALVILEAMSCGLPCISFNCPYGPSEIIKDGQDGILVENGNVKALSKALVKLMSNDTQRQEMGERAAGNISRFNPNEIMGVWCKLFKDL